MSHYTHLTTDEREKAMIFLSEGLSFRAIARKLNRAVSTISREIARNKKFDNSYSAAYAEKRYKRRRKKCHRQYIFFNTELKDYVIERMQLKWTPEQIAGRAKLDKLHIPFSYSSIYRAIDMRILPFELKQGMRFKSKYKKHKQNDKRGSLQGITSIDKRPNSVNNRKNIGHWESDCVLGMRKTGVIATHVERKTGFLLAGKLSSTFSGEFNDLAALLFKNIPKRFVKSLTVDRGSEFKDFNSLAAITSAKIYFCHPYSPWEKGTNENTNGLLRQFYPKKTSFATITDDDLLHIVSLINNRPRKRLGFKTPAEIFYKVLHLV